MFEPNAVSLRTALALTAVLLFSVAITLNAGAPIRGADVKLGKSPGGNAAARATTDGSGHFNLGVQPAGSYTVSIDVPADTGATVTVKGAVGGTIKRSSQPASQTARAAAAPVKIELKSDGKTPLTGICETAVIRSRSNVKNNR